MRYSALFSILLFCYSLSGQPDYADSVYHKDHVFGDNIKSVQLFRDGWNLSYPIMKMNSNDKLALSFDLLGDNPETFYYTFIHCDKDWNKSDIFLNDYLDGFYENPIEDYKSSFNTTVDYIHYKLIFPNDRINIRLSGNYIVIIYPEGKPGKTGHHPEIHGH